MNNENKDIKDIKSPEDNNNLEKEELSASAEQDTSAEQVSKDDTKKEEVKDVSKEEISNSSSALNNKTNQDSKELEPSKDEKDAKMMKPSFLKSDFHGNIDNLLEDNKDSKDHKDNKANCASKYKDTPSFSLKEMLVIITITGVICAFAGGAVINHKYSTKNGTSYATLLKDENLKEFLDVYATLNEDYYASVDKKSAIDGAIDGLMKNAYDDYTSYLDKDAASSLNDSLNGTYEGIGISISNATPGLIVKVYLDSPAKKAGLLENDIITAINSQDISSLSSSEIAKLIKESQNKKVNLTIKRGEETFNVDVNIETLSTPAVDYKVLSNEEKKVGYLAITTFSNTLGNQVKSALEEMEGMGIESLILDLRNNGGGLLSAAVDVANLFLEKGKAIYGLEGKDGENTKFYYDTTSTKREYPIVILMNGATASASEILASALIDSYGATSVGTTSYGKGKVQQTKRLSDGSLVKYTTSRWVTPNNECIDTYGISPQYGVELDIKYDDEENIIGVTDNQLAKARSLLGLPEYDETNPRYEDTLNNQENNDLENKDNNQENNNSSNNDNAGSNIDENKASGE